MNVPGPRLGGNQLASHPTRLGAKGRSRPAIAGEAYANPPRSKRCGLAYRSLSGIVVLARESAHITGVELARAQATIKIRTCPGILITRLEPGCFYVSGRKPFQRLRYKPQAGSQPAGSPIYVGRYWPKELSAAIVTEATLHKSCRSLCTKRRVSTAAALRLEALRGLHPLGSCGADAVAMAHHARR